MRVALLAYSAPAGDAIGNQLAEKLAFFLERGADARVFLESDYRLHPALVDQGSKIEDRRLKIANRGLRIDGREGTWEFLASADLILVDYSQYYSSLDWLPVLTGGKARIVFDYHGVTPPHLWGASNREAIEKGSRRLGSTVGSLNGNCSMPRVFLKPGFVAWVTPSTWRGFRQAHPGWIGDSG